MIYQFQVIIIHLIARNGIQCYQCIVIVTYRYNNCITKQYKTKHKQKNAKNLLEHNRKNEALTEKFE